MIPLVPDVMPVASYGELFAHTLILMALFYGAVAIVRRVRHALRREALDARIAELREEVLRREALTARIAELRAELDRCG